jgi:hypothetical protein
MFRSRRDKGKDQVRHRGRVVDLSASRFGRRRSGAPGRRAPSRWRRVGAFVRPLFALAQVALIVAAALIVLGDRVDWRQVLGADWVSDLVGRAPIRAAINVRAERSDCQVARVIDGDTVDLECGAGGELMRTRLMGYDTPEVYSPKCDAELALGNQATQALERRVNGSRRVLVAFRGTDRYGRHLARLMLDGTDVAVPLIEAGLARPYEGGRREGWCG